MKKISLFGLCLFLLSLTVFISCSKDDDNNGNENGISKIIGKWQIKEVKINGIVDDPTSDEGYFYPCDYQGWSLFKEDGTFDEYDACEDKNLPSGNWEINNHTLLITTKDFPTPIEIILVEVSDSILILKYLSEVEEVITYKRLD
ncbi:hypothetical protein EZS27_007736 [termite gut metagenome]|uniref:Lipocalin-like domain-containing protein n=1 Tax=termite gut metagenome TaxID=433724 RepID=A0A5J4SF03_9ZZZZ